MANVTSQQIAAASGPKREAGTGEMRRYAYERIVDFLNTGSLHPGQLISQRELVDMSGATLGSVRETVPRLEAEGLLVTVPKRGLMIPSLDVAFVREAYEVRAMIERQAVPAMIGGMRDDEITAYLDGFDALETQIREAGPVTPPELLARMQREDWHMHADFVARMNNKLMANIYRVTAIKIRMAVQARLQVTEDNAERVLAEHRTILIGLRNRDKAATEAALMHHINVSLRLALGI